MSQNIKHIDFEILKEYWNKYELSDGTYVKTRAILKEIMKIPQGKEFEYRLGFQHLQAIFPSLQSRGNTSTQPSSQEQLQNSDWTDMRYNTVSEEWNEYFADDGTRVRLKVTVTQIRKSSIYMPNGDPIYNIGVNILPQISPQKT